MSASELQALVAPIALDPDGLVAQILAAATFPDQVAIADYWVQQNRNLRGTSLRHAACQAETVVAVCRAGRLAH
jgi:hypothetical protein